LKLPQENGKQGPAARTNDKQDNYDQIHADNPVWGFAFTEKNIRVIFFLKEEHKNSKKPKTTFIYA
jgi:hypothetical protein